MAVRRFSTLFLLLFLSFFAGLIVACPLPEGATASVNPIGVTYVGDVKSGPYFIRFHLLHLPNGCMLLASSARGMTMEPTDCWSP